MNIPCWKSYLFIPYCYVRNFGESSDRGFFMDFYLTFMCYNASNCNNNKINKTITATITTTATTTPKTTAAIATKNNSNSNTKSTSSNNNKTADNWHVKRKHKQCIIGWGRPAQISKKRKNFLSTHIFGHIFGESAQNVHKGEKLLCLAANYKKKKWNKSFRKMN